MQKEGTRPNVPCKVGEESLSAALLPHGLAMWVSAELGGRSQTNLGLACCKNSHLRSQENCK